MPRLRWTRDRVVLELGRLCARGEDLTTRRLQRTGHGGLVAAAYRLFGTWRAALASASVEPRPRQRRRRTTEDIVAAIRRHALVGRDVSCAALRKHDAGLVRAAYRDPALGSWAVALEQAGLSGRAVRGRWSRAAILDRIREMVARGEDVSAGAVRAREQRLMSAACRPQHFGSWAAALTAAGLRPDDWRQRTSWSRERVTKTLQQLHAEGLPLSTSWLQAHGHSSLVSVARRPDMFGSWRDAVEAAGIDYDQVRREARLRRRGS